VEKKKKHVKIVENPSVECQTDLYTFFQYLMDFLKFLDDQITNGAIIPEKIAEEISIDSSHSQFRKDSLIDEIVKS